MDCVLYNSPISSLLSAHFLPSGHCSSLSAFLKGTLVAVITPPILMKTSQDQAATFLLVLQPNSSVSSCPQIQPLSFSPCLSPCCMHTHTNKRNYTSFYYKSLSCIFFLAKHLTFNCQGFLYLLHAEKCTKTR